MARTPKTDSVTEGKRPAAKAEPASRGEAPVKPRAAAKPAAPKAAARPVAPTRPAARSTTPPTAKAAASARPAASSKPAARGAKAAEAPRPAAKLAAAKAARPAAKAAPTSRARPASRNSAPEPTGRARTTLGAGNAQVKPRTRPAKPSPEAEALAAAEPKRPRTRKRPASLSPDRLETLVTAARKSLEDDKAEDIKVLDVTGRASFTDRIIIATGLADRQIQAMATHLEEALAKEGLKLKRNAIEASPDWVLIDCGDMVIHLFKPEARDSFRLEKMWGEDSPKADSGTGYEPT